MEQLIRTRWIRFFFFFTAIEILFIILTDEVFSRLVLLLQQYFSMGILYYFAFKRRGTKWLLFFLIATPLAEIKTFFYLRHHATFLSAMLFLIELSLVSYFWILNFRLWKVNRAAKSLSPKKVIAGDGLE